MSETGNQAELSPRDEALARCTSEIAWYTRNKHRAGRLYRLSTFAAVLLGAATPVLILWTELPDVLKAIPAALAAVVTGLNAIFQWHEHYARYAYVLEALKSEMFKYKTRTTADYRKDLDDYTALENFVTRIDALIMNEVNDWGAQVREVQNVQAN